MGKGPNYDYEQLRITSGCFRRPNKATFNHFLFLLKLLSTDLRPVVPLWEVTGQHDSSEQVTVGDKNCFLPTGDSQFAVFFPLLLSHSLALATTENTSDTDLGFAKTPSRI